jgi:flagellar motor switch/type III secretory pathway protein FliN
MATAHPLPTPTLAQNPAANSTAESAAEQALVSSAPLREKEQAEAETEFDGTVARLPVEVDVAIPVREFRVRNLLALAPGAIIESQWNHGEDLPLAAGDVQLAWSEFEVIDSGLAVRITHLA